MSQRTTKQIQMLHSNLKSLTFNFLQNDFQQQPCYSVNMDMLLCIIHKGKLNVPAACSGMVVNTKNAIISKFLGSKIKEARLNWKVFCVYSVVIRRNRYVTFNARISDTIFSFKGDQQVIFINTHFFFFLLQTACFLMIVIRRELKPVYCEMLQSFGEFKQIS